MQDPDTCHIKTINAPAVYYFTLDAETIYPVCGNRETPRAGYTYAKNWQDYKGMGVACVCAWDAVLQRPLTYLADNLDQLAAHAHNANVVVTYNGVKFDYPLLAAHGIKLPEHCHYDLLREIWLALGLDPDRFNPQTHGGLGLDLFALANLGYGKGDFDGWEAAHCWQRGEYGKVITYCHNDVLMTYELVLRLVANGGLINPKVKAFMPIRRPGEMPGAFLTRKSDYYAEERAQRHGGGVLPGIGAENLHTAEGARRKRVKKTLDEPTWGGE